MNNREVATLIWIVVVLIAVAIYPKTRESLLNVVKAATQWKLMLVVLIAFSYVVIVTFALYFYGLWKYEYIFASGLWFFTAGLSMLGKIVDDPDDTSMKDILRNGVRISLVVEFYIGLYTPPLWGELLLVPFVAFLVILKAFADQDSSAKVVSQFLDILLAFIGVGIVVYCSIHLLLDVDEAISIDTLLRLLLPFFYMALAVPGLYFLALYVCYENVFVTMKVFIKDKKLRAYAKKSVLISLRCDKASIKRWRRVLVEKRPSTQDEIQEALRISRFPSDFGESMSGS